MVNILISIPLGLIGKTMLCPIRNSKRKLKAMSRRRTVALSVLVTFYSFKQKIKSTMYENEASFFHAKWEKLTLFLEITEEPKRGKTQTRRLVTLLVFLIFLLSTHNSSSH